MTDRYAGTGGSGSPRNTENAYSGLDLVSGGAILVIACVLLVHLVIGGLVSQDQPQGIVSQVIRETGDQLNIFGSIAGFPAISGQLGGLFVQRANPDQNRLGGVGMTLSLFISSTGGIDMTQTTVLWIDRSSTKAIPFTKGRPVICPNWTIVNKININPFKTADDNDILEPGEQFDIFICPAGTYAPYDEFIIEYEPPGSGPHFPVKCTVPFPITRTMGL